MAVWVSVLGHGGLGMSLGRYGLGICLRVEQFIYLPYGGSLEI